MEKYERKNRTDTWAMIVLLECITKEIGENIKANERMIKECEKFDLLIKEMNDRLNWNFTK